MDLDPKAFFALLAEYLEDPSTGPAEAKRLLSVLNDNFTNEQCNITVVDIYLLHIFHDSPLSLQHFITTAAGKPPFKQAVVKSLEILFALLNNFPAKVEQYIKKIHHICLKLVKSALTSADEKVKALEVLNLSFEKINTSVEDTEHYLDVYNDLRRSFNIRKANQVHDKIMVALGTFAKQFETVIVEESENLRALFLTGINTQPMEKLFSLQVVHGTFTGLNKFCEAFPFDLSIDEDKAIVLKLYKFIEQLATPPAGKKIRTPYRAVLFFFADNINLFGEQIVRDYEKWHRVLLDWLLMGVEDQKVGGYTLEAFYRGLAEYLKSDEGLSHKSCTLYFLEYFVKILEGDAQAVISYEKKAVLRGLSAFSPVFYAQIDPQQVAKLSILIVETFEMTYIITQQKDPDTLQYQPIYVETIASFMRLQKITSSEMFCLQRGVITMIKTYPKLPYSYQPLVVNALVTTSQCLHTTDETLFNSFMEQIVYQAVIWSCSHQHLSELIDPNASVTVKNYMSLWIGLLKIGPDRSFDKLGVFLHDRNAIVKKVVETLIRTLLIMIHKLNVTIVQNEEILLTDVQASHKLAQVDDFAIFLNLVDLYHEVLPEIEPSMLKKCIGSIIRHLIDKSIRCPLISGFYKLLASCLEICRRLDYFTDRSQQDVAICYESVSKFVSILLRKTKQFKDDLLISCLQVLFVTPVTIIADILPDCVPAFVTVFDCGRSYIQLAHMALATLEYWQDTMDSEVIEDFLKDILPCLDSYLRSTSLGAFSQGKTALLQGQQRRKTAKALKNRKVLVEIEPELVKLQKRILNFVGRQNSDLCLSFVLPRGESHATWGNRELLKVTFPYEDLRIDVFLDRFTPRVVDLSLSSSDRKTRVAACELLQAIVMIFLGSAKSMTKNTGLDDLNELLKNMAFPLLRLGCDLDHVVQQLFEPLFFQLIHWYTHPTQLRGDHSAIIIEAVMEGITHPTDSSLRDFSGKCVTEFATWTIKQSSDATLEKDPLNIKVLIKKMRFFSLHPDPFKKLGAALIFNHIYKEIREESVLLSTFWIECLHIFVKSLALIEFNCNADDDNILNQINCALTHLQRGFVEKSKLFNKSDKNRRIPCDFTGDTLTEVCLFLMTHTGSPKSQHCRLKSMELFSNIAPHVTGCKSLSDFITRKVPEPEAWIKNTYEGFLAVHPTLASLDRQDLLFKWMEGLMCALDGYHFILKNNLWDSDKVLQSSEVNLSQALLYFTQTVALRSFQDVLDLIDSKTWTWTTYEKQEFDKRKSAIVLKILSFLNTLANNQCLGHSFYNKDTWQLIVNVVFNRDTLGFDLFDSDSDCARIVPLLSNFIQKLPDQNIDELVDSINTYIEANELSDIHLKGHVPRKDRNLIKGLLLLKTCNARQLNANFAARQYSKGWVTFLLQKFMMVDPSSGSSEIFAEELQDTLISHCSAILDFCLDDEDEFATFVNFLYQPYKVHSMDSQKPLHFGCYILSLFEDCAISKICDHFETFLDLGLRSSVERSLELLEIVFNHVVQRKEFRTVAEYLIKQTVQSWHKFQVCFDTDIVKGTEFVKVLLPLIVKYKDKIQCGDLKRWVIVTLGQGDNVDFKVNVFQMLLHLLSHDSDLQDLDTSLSVMKDQLDDARKVERLLTIIPTIEVCDLLLFLLDLYVKFSDQCSKVDMQTLLTGYIKRNSDSVQTDTLDQLYNCIISQSGGLHQYKLFVTSVPLFLFSDSGVFENFCVRNIAQLITILESPSSSLMLKTFAFVMVEIIFVRTPILSSSDRVSNITKAAMPHDPKNKTLLMTLFKHTLGAFKEDHRTVDDELVRLYRCHAYNAQVSIVCNSLKNESFYTKLFVRMEGDTDVLWTGLIRTDTRYVFAKDFDTIPLKKKVLVNIRDNLKVQRKSSQSQSARYLQSQRIFNSSLSEDLTKFDFTNTNVRSQVVEFDREGESRSDVRDLQGEIELDCVDVNEHECMGVVCGLIKHLVLEEVTVLPTDEDTEESYTLPAWIKGLINLLLNDNIHVNVKIFWVKVIDNMMYIFKCFARWLLEPLLKFVVDKTAGDNINYFITDVIVILATWSSSVLPSKDSEIALASQLLRFFVHHLNNDRNDIFKYHLELVKLITESWKSILELPYDLIRSKLSHEVSSKRNEVGIHLCSIFLANRLSPWDVDDNYASVCKKIFAIVGHNTVKTSYKTAAETIGLILRHVQGKSIESKVLDNVNKLLKGTKDVDKYGHCLEAITLHYPKVADNFHLCRLLSRLHTMPTSVKAVYLRIILKRSDILESIRDFKEENWDQYLENEDLEIQLLALEIIYKNVDVLKTCPSFQTTVLSMCRFVSSPNVLLRHRLYDIAIALMDSDPVPDILNLCQDILIQGFVDSDEEIQTKVIQFWEEYSDLPSHISDRFSYALSSLYKNSTENNFLGYSSYLLLKLLTKTDGYADKKLFEHPLEDCNFEDYHLQTNWRVRHLSVVPMFAETLRTLTQSSDQVVTDLDHLRQTQNSLSFAPTQIDKPIERQVSQYTLIESSFLIKPDDERRFLDPNSVTLSQKYKIPKRRFLRDKAKIRQQFAHHEVTKKVLVVEKRQDLAKERENKVTIYRKYRKGDLPDIQISLEAVLEPLAALALLDGEIGKLFYLSIFKSISSKHHDSEEFTSQIADSIKTIFTNSTQFNTTLFRTLLEIISLNPKSMPFEPSLITTACESSGLLELGSCLLETYLLNMDGDGPSSSKRLRGQRDGTESAHWLKLAELYKEMDEWDIVKSIFLEKLECKDNMVQKALMSEAQKQWRTAQELYFQLIEDTGDEVDKRDFYYESYFKCFAHLGEWDNLITAIEQVVESTGDIWDNLWDREFNQQKLLPWYVESQVKNTLFTQQSPNVFLEHLNKTLYSDNCDYLESNFSEELAVVWLFQQDLEMSKHYINICIDQFLEKWPLLDCLHSNVRYSKLLKLRNMIDLNRFVNVYQSLGVESESDIKSVMKYWNTDEKLPSILMVETRNLYRRQFSILMKRKIESLQEDDLNYLVEELEQMKFRLDSGIVDAAIDQDNFYMGKKYFAALSSNRSPAMLKFCLSKLGRVKASMMETDEDKVKTLINSLAQLGPVFHDSQRWPLKLSGYLHQLSNLDQIAKICGHSEELFTRFSAEPKLISIVDNRKIKVADSLPIYGADKLRDYLRTCEQIVGNAMDSSGSSKDLQIVAQAYVKLAYFAKDRGRDFMRDFVFSVLRAMKFDSAEARQLFPCLLVDRDWTDDVRGVFVEESAAIPTWMFLGWIPQLLATMDTPNNAKAIGPILIRIATAYPQSIMYAYRLSKENYRMDSLSREAKTLIYQLDDLLLSDPRVDLFLKALSSVSVPATVLQYYTRKMAKASGQNNAATITTLIQSVQSQIYDSTPDSRDSESLQGNMYKKISTFKKDFSNVSINNAKTKLPEINQKLEVILSQQKSSQLLKDYCPWLANFSADKLNLELEIPGQYTGKKMPLPQHHTKISCFSPHVNVMSSLRKPIQITILGNDTKEYPYLVKFGEDIRQDQRIQQLFSLMNEIFRHDPTSNQRQLTISTYQVVPLTSSLGIIQWIDNTRSLLDFVKRSLDTKELKSFKGLSDVYYDFIAKASRKGKGLLDVYALAAKNYTKDKTVAKFRALVNNVPWDVLRTSFMDLSSNTETFSALRHNFIRSYAIMCVSHWLLGIGDRHLDNSLVCTKTGKVLGIDFGHAFGTATQILPVPELVPFRLTPHLVYLMEPLGERGLFREIMVHTMRSLRSNSSSLLATMDVFIQEPSLDWLESADLYEHEDGLNWYPNQKIKQARRKLEGASSVTIMVEELTASYKLNDEYIGSYVRLVTGESGVDLRAQEGKIGDGLSVEDQVDCLIDHATDYNLLGRMFQGWNAWV